MREIITRVAVMVMMLAMFTGSNFREAGIKFGKYWPMVLGVVIFVIIVAVVVAFLLKYKKKVNNFDNLNNYDNIIRNSLLNYSDDDSENEKSDKDNLLLNNPKVNDEAKAINYNDDKFLKNYLVVNKVN